MINRFSSYPSSLLSLSCNWLYTVFAIATFSPDWMWKDRKSLLLSSSFGAHPRSDAKAKRELSLVRRPTFSFLSLLRGRFVQYIKKFLYKVFSSLLSPLSTFGLTCEFPFLPVAVLTKSCLSLLMRHSHLSLHNKLPTVLLQCTYLISETILAVKTDKFVIRIQFDSIRLAI